MSDRTRKDVDQEYSNEALQLGHKMRLMNDLEQEIPAHTEKLSALAKEAQALPADEPVLEEVKQAEVAEVLPKE